MKLHSLRFAPIALVSAVAFSSSADADPPGVSGVSIDSIQYEGDGCPAGSVTSTLTPDGRTLDLLFSRYVVSIGPGTAPEQSSKGCFLHLKLRVPKSYAYAIAAIDYRGYASLDEGVSGSQSATYHFSGEAPEPGQGKTITGPYDDDYAVQDAADPSGYLWSRCGKGNNVQIRTRVQLDSSRNPNGSGLFTVDAVDGAVTQSYHLVWQRCR